MESILDRREGALPMIFCPMTNFKRPVVSCMCSCKKKDVNWCHKIKKVAIEELDDVSSDLPDANLATWEERRDFFMTPNLGNRKQHDDYDETIHGGAGLKSIEELDEQQTPTEADDAIDPDPPVPDDENQAVGDDDDFQRGPYTPDGDDEPGDSEPDPGEPHGDDESGEAGGESLAESISKEASDDGSGDPDDGDSGDGTENDGETQEGDGMVRKKCPHCDKMFKNARGLGIHVGRAHPGKETPAAGSTEKTPKKSAASASSPPAKPDKKKKRKSKKGESNGPWIILGKDGQGVLIEDSEKLADTYQEMRLEIEEEGKEDTVRIFEVAKEVTVQTEITIVDI